MLDFRANNIIIRLSYCWCFTDQSLDYCKLIIWSFTFRILVVMVLQIWAYWELYLRSTWNSSGTNKCLNRMDLKSSFFLSLETLIHETTTSKLFVKSLSKTSRPSGVRFTSQRTLKTWQPLTISTLISNFSRTRSSNQTSSWRLASLWRTVSLISSRMKTFSRAEMTLRAGFRWTASLSL